MTTEKATVQGAKALEFHGGSLVSFLPFIIFIVAVITLGLLGGFSLQAFVGFAVVGLIIGTFFAKDWGRYWDAVMHGITDRSTGILVAIFLMAGLFSNLMANGRLAEGIVWAGYSIGLTGSAFVAFTFIASLLFGLATGTSVGTVITMTPIFFPAGMLLGGNPVFLLGAILSGAAFGDNLAPVSDTTIISASSQAYSRKPGYADVGGVVASRAKYAIIAAAVALVLYLVLGAAGAADIRGDAAMLAKYSYPLGLVMLVPMIIVIWIAVSGRSIFTALIGGILSGSVIGIVAGILKPSSFIQIKNGDVAGIIPGGVGGVFASILVYMAIMAMMGVVRSSGALDRLTDALTAHVAKSPRGCEATIFASTTVMGVLNSGITTSVVAIMGPIVNSIGGKWRIHPYRRANLVDAVANTWAYFIPWSAFIFIVSGIIGSMKDAYPFLVTPKPTSYFFAAFHPWALWFVILFSVVTGFGRIFEGRDGRVINAWFSNRVPEEAQGD
ncbi:MAG: Na+/H+ antiporter NhaC family protein [Bacillota bacterium]|nr:Na+/H+ antiporter NhaC family protein [Bacillota bacterium]